jgi:hypothetical protein
MCEKTCLAKQTLLSRVATLTYFFLSTKEKQRRAERHILALKTELSEAYGVIVALSAEPIYMQDREVVLSYSNPTD